MADLSPDEMADFPSDMGEQLRLSKTLKTIDIRQWDVCSAFLEGRQYLNYDRTSGNFLQMDPMGAVKSKATVNVLLPIWRSQVSRLSVNYPSIAVTPTSPDSAEVSKAIACQEALKWYWGTERLEYKFAELVKWLLQVGNGGLHTYWDSVKSKIATDCVDPYDLFFEANCLSPEESQWIAVRRLEGKKELMAAYPDKVDQIKSVGSPVNRDTWNNRQTQYPAHRVETYDIYWKDGRHGFCLSDGIYLDKARTPGNVVPVQFVRYSDIKNKLWGLGMVYNALDSQAQLNKSRNLVFENSETTANPVWMIPTSCDVDPKSITNKPGSKIFYNPIGGKPELARGGELPSYFLQNTQMILGEINDLTGSQDTSRGKKAVGVSSGVAIEAITQNDVGQLQLTQSNIEKAACEMATVVLTFMQAMYTSPQMVRMLDNTGRVIFKQLSQTDLIENPEVWIEAGSLFRNEAEDRDQQTMQLYNAKLLTPEQTLERLSGRFGNSQAVKKMVAFSKAQDILAAVKTGQYDVVIRSTEDLSALVQVFTEFSETPDYYGLPLPVQDQIWNILVAMTNPALKDPNAQASIVWPQAPPALAPPPQGPGMQAEGVGPIMNGNTLPPPPPPEDAAVVPQVEMPQVPFKAAPPSDRGGRLQ